MKSVLHYALTLMLSFFSIAVIAQNVGIGTANPNYPLEVNGSIGINDTIFHNGDADSYLLFTENGFQVIVGGSEAFYADEDSVIINTGDGVYEISSDLNLNGDDLDHLFFASQEDNRIGIGTDDPQYLLDVNGDVNVAGDLLGTVFSTDNANSTFGIGTPMSPADLDVNGDGKFTGDVDVAGDLLGTVFATDNANNSFNIGTLANPADLDVNGDGKFTGDVDVAGDLLGTVFSTDNANNSFNIGTLANPADLDVNGDGKFTGDVDVAGDLLGTVFSTDNANNSFNIGTLANPADLDVNGGGKFTGDVDVAGDLLGTVFSTDNANNEFKIGTASENADLDVNGGGKFTGDVDVAGDLLGTVFSTDNANNEFKIGTASENADLDVNGGGKFTGDVDVAGDLLGTVFSTDNTNNEFKIGTASENADLDVNGGGKFTGDVDVAGDLLGTVFSTDNTNNEFKIGTASENADLDVNGGGKFTGDVDVAGDLLGTVFSTDNTNNTFKIGTDSSPSDLDMVGDGQIDGTLRIVSGSGFLTTESAILEVEGHMITESFEVTGTTTLSDIETSEISTDKINIKDGVNTKITIDGAGSFIGIGATASTSSHNLDINGSSRFHGSTVQLGNYTQTNGNYEFAPTAGSSGLFKVNTNDIQFINNDGNGQINIDNSGIKLQGNTTITNLTVTGSSSFSEFESQNIAADYFSLKDAEETTTIKMDGQNTFLGIGVTSSSYNLHVNGTAYFNGSITQNGSISHTGAADFNGDFAQSGGNFSQTGTFTHEGPLLQTGHYNQSGGDFAYTSTNVDHDFKVKSDNISLQSSDGTDKLLITTTNTTVEGDLQVNGTLSADSIAITALDLTSEVSVGGGSTVQMWQAGIADIPNADLLDAEFDEEGVGHEVYIPFPTAFSSTPVFTATYQYEGADDEEHVIVAIKEITSTYVKLQLRKIDIDDNNDEHLGDYNDWTAGKIHWSALAVPNAESSTGVTVTGTL